MESRTRAESVTGEPLPLDWEGRESGESTQAEAGGTETSAPIASYPAPESFQQMPPPKPSAQVIDLTKLPDALGPTLRAYRENLGCSRAEIAVRMKVSEAYITALEEGDYHYSEFKDIFFLRRHLKRLCQELLVAESLSEHLMGLLEKEYRKAGRSVEDSLSGVNLEPVQLEKGSRSIGEVIFRKLPVIALFLLGVTFTVIIVIAFVHPMWVRYGGKGQSRVDLAPYVPAPPVKAELAPIP